MNPILLDFPTQFETERLLIRAPKPGDGAAINEAICESELSLKPWMPFANPVPTLEQSEQNTREAWVKFLSREDLRMSIYDRVTGRFVGSSGLHHIDWQVRRFEIGFWLRDSESGKGYMTEAVVGIAQFASEQLGAQRLEIQCDSRNARSRRVAERCGFHLEGTLRNNRIDVKGDLEHTCIYAQVRRADGSWGYPAAE